MNNVTGNCTSAKADITVKTVFDGKQNGQQAFMKLIQRQYRISGADIKNTDIDKTQYTDYTKDSEANVGGTIVGFAENGGQRDMLETWCQEHRYTVAGVYADDGYSGLYMERPDFQRMLADCKQGKIEIKLA